MSRLKSLRKIHFLYFSALLISLVMITSTALALQPLNQNQSEKLNIVSNNKYTPGFQIDQQANQQYKGHNFDNYQTGNNQVSPNVQVNAPQQFYPNGLIGDSETTITAVKDGKDLVAGFNDAQGFCGAPYGTNLICPPAGGLSGYAYSTDGGKTWTDGGAPPMFNGVFSRGDPWLASSGNTVYYANLVVNNETGNSLGVGVWRGHFTREGGFVWTDVHTMDSPLNAISPGADFYDKDSMSVSGNNVYITITNFQEICGIPEFGFGTITLWASHDGGNTWSGPTVVSPDQSFIHNSNNSQCGLTGSVQQGSVSAVGPQGQVYVSWVKGPTYFTNSISPISQIMEATSFNGGRSFGKPVVVAAYNSAAYDAPVDFNRATILDSPRIAVTSSGLYAGRVYVSYFGAVTPNHNFNTSQQNLISTQIYLKYSDNFGRTWHTVYNIVPPVPQTTVKQFWPVVVTGQDGNVNIVYYQSIENPATSNSYCAMPLDNGGTRAGYAHSLVDTYMVTSNNGGFSFSAPIRVSSVTTDWCNVYWNIYPNMGDYIGAAAAGNQVFAVWADGRNGIPDTFFASIQVNDALFSHNF